MRGRFPTRDALAVRGTVVGTEEGADAQADSLTEKCPDLDTYPMRRPDEVRVSYRVRADKMTCDGNDQQR